MHATTQAVLFALFMFILTVEARSHSHDHDGLTIEQHEEPIEGGNMARPTKERSNRRKRYWQWHNDNPSRNSQYGQDALEQVRMQYEILRKLDEILIYLRTPPPPPPPPAVKYVYVNYPVRRRCNCTQRPANVPSGVNTRFPEMEDSRLNWGAVDYEYPDEEFNRPLSFDPIERSTVRPIRPSNNPVTTAPKESNSSDQECFAAVLTCCNQPITTQSKCIADRGCPSASCTQSSVDAAFDFFSKTYAPKN